jgi:hypothetical protein
MRCRTSRRFASILLLLPVRSPICRTGKSGQEGGRRKKIRCNCSASRRWEKSPQLWPRSPPADPIEEVSNQWFSDEVRRDGLPVPASAREDAPQGSAQSGPARAAPWRGLSQSGTTSSNPAPSSAESATNRSHGVNPELASIQWLRESTCRTGRPAEGVDTTEQLQSHRVTPRSKVQVASRIALNRLPRAVSGVSRAPGRRRARQHAFSSHWSASPARCP